MLETVTFPEIQPGEKLATDVLVIGSGAGGAVAAKILSESGREVTVVEEGGYFDVETYGENPAKRVANMWRLGYETQAQGSTVIHIPTGRVVGGSTVINSGSCFRPPERVTDRWVQYGLDDLALDALVPELEEIEEILSIKEIPEEVFGGNGSLVRKGAEALGLSGGKIHRAIDGCKGASICVLGCPNNAKQAMHISYLPRAQASGAKIVERVRVERVVIEGGRAKGAVGRLVDEKQRDLGPVEFEAAEVIVSAGPIHTPVILERSGVGNPEHLGKHLQIHPCAGVMAIFDGQVETSPNTLQSYYIDEFAETDGLIMEATSLVAGMNPGMDTSNRAFLGIFSFDRSEGEIILREDGSPQPRYEIHPDDIGALAFGTMQAARVFLSAGASEVRTGHPELKSVRSFAEAEKIPDLRWDAAMFRPTAFHPVGTARMGADPETSVVDPAGRVWEFPNLRVADASLLPSCPEVNPQVTVMALSAVVARQLATSG